MTQTYQSGLDFTLSQKVSPADTTIYLTPVPTVTAGRIYLVNAAQEERISFTGVTATAITGCTRGLSQTADPATSGTGLTWIAGVTGVLVGMHDQYIDKQQSNTYGAGSVQTMPDLAFNGTATVGLKVKSLTTAQRTGASNIVNGSMVYDSTLGEFYVYQGGAWSAVASGSTQPNASTTVAGKVELPDDAEVTAGTATGGTGAPLTPTNAQTIKSISLKAAVTELSTSDNFVIQDASDSDKDKKVSGTLTRQFMNMTELTAGENLTAGDLVSVYTDGSARKTIKSNTSVAQLGTITGLDVGERPVQTIYLSIDKAVVLYQKSADNIVYARVVTFAQRTPTLGTEQAVSSALAVDGMYATIALTSSLFVVAYNKSTGDKAYATACTVSGTTITAGTEVDMSDGTTCSGSTGVSICKLSDTKFVCGWLGTVSSDCTINAGSISGTTITAGTSAVMEAATSVGVPIMVYAQDDVIGVFYDDGTNVTFKAVTYSGTTATVRAGIDTVTGSLSYGNARAIYIENGRFQLYFSSATGIIRVVSINVADQSLWNTVHYDVQQLFGVYTDALTGSYMDVCYMGNKIISMVTQMDSLSDIRLRLFEIGINGLREIYNVSLATTVTVGLSCCQLTNTQDKVLAARKVGADLYYSVYRDNSQNFAGVVKTTTSAAASTPIIRAGDAAIAGLTAGLAYYVGDAGAVSTSGTKRIGVATTTTNLFIN